MSLRTSQAMEAINRWTWRGRWRRSIHCLHEKTSTGRAILLHSARDSGFPVYATTFPELFQELQDARFLALEVLSPRAGAPLLVEEPRDEPDFQIIARRPGPVQA